MSAQDWATSCITEELLNSCLRQETVLFSKVSMPAAGPTQPPIQWVMCTFLGVKQPGCEANHFPPFSTEVRNVWSHTATCQMWHGVNFTFTCSSCNVQYCSHVCVT